MTAHLSRCPERVLGGHVLDVVGQRVVGQDVIGLVDAVHGVLEGELRRRILLVIFGRYGRRREKKDVIDSQTRRRDALEMDYLETP